MVALHSSPWSCYAHFHGYTTLISVVTLHPSPWSCYTHFHGYTTLISVVMQSWFPWLVYTHFHWYSTSISLVTMHPFPWLHYNNSSKLSATSAESDIHQHQQTVADLETKSKGKIKGCMGGMKASQGETGSDTKQTFFHTLLKRPACSTAHYHSLQTNMLAHIYTHPLLTLSFNPLDFRLITQNLLWII